MLRFEAQDRLVHADTLVEAITDAHVVWFTEDMPVDAQDRGDTDGLVERVVDVLARVPSWTLVLLSSQVPIGTTERIARVSGHARIGYIPENLKRGAGVHRFLHADRFVAGVLHEVDRWIVEGLLQPFGRPIEWMTVRAAEATKHAINSYLAMCITLANELGQICAAHGIDPHDVERGLRTDARVGHGPPVTPGGPIRGGTLLRDVWYLEEMAARLGLDLPLVRSIHQSNTLHLQRAESPGARTA